MQTSNLPEVHHNQVLVIWDFYGATQQCCLFEDFPLMSASLICSTFISVAILISIQ